MYTIVDSGNSYLDGSLLPYLAELLITKNLILSWVANEYKVCSRWCEQLIDRLGTEVTFTRTFYPLNSYLKNNAGA